MIKNRRNNNIQSFWGASIQPERMQTCLRYIAKNDKILDVGCGKGAYISYFSQYNLSAVGVDINYYEDWSKNKLREFIIGSGTSLPFKRKTFDVAIAFETVEHCDDPHLFLDNLIHCTKKWIILSVPNCNIDNNLRKYDLAMAHWTDQTHCNFFTKESISKLLQDKGLELIEVKYCYPIYPNNYYWDTLRIPKFISNLCKKVIQKLNLSESYNSSILIVASIPMRGE